MSNFTRSLLVRTGLVSAALSLTAPAALAAVVEGKITAAGDLPLSGAIVSILETGQSTSTGSDGGYRFGNVPEGDYTLKVTYIGADAQTLSISASDTAPATYNLSMDDTTKVMDSILVTGQSGSMFAGINESRAADNLISVLSADALGQFPDQNVAESVRRVAGISVANDQGEGRFVVIRGIDPNLNATSVNGVRVAAPEAGSRAVALDVIDSDILESIEITKSLTPDLDGDGIGGSINIKTMSAFDRDGMHLKVKADGIYSELSEEWGHKLGVTASNIFMDDRLGIAGSIAWNKRDFITTNTEGDGYVIGGPLENTLYPEELELRQYEVTRERISSALNFDFRLNNSTDLYLRTLYNSFEDQEKRHRTEIKPSDGDNSTLTSVVGGLATFTTINGDDEAVFEIDRDIKDRLETQSIWSIQTGGQTLWDEYTFDYQLAFTHAEEEEPNALETAFRAKFDGEDEPGYMLGLDLSDGSLPRFVSVDGSTTAALFDAGNYDQDETELTDGLTEEEELAFKIDLKREGNVFGQPGFVKGGIKTRIRQKSYDVDVTLYEWDGANDLLLSQFEIMPEYGLGDFGPSGDPAALRSHFFGNIDSFDNLVVDSALASYGQRFEAAEHIYAGYMMAQLEAGSATITGGARMEVTDFLGEGFITTYTEDGVVAPGALVAVNGDDERVYADFSSERNSYVDFLPSLNAKFDMTETLVGRAAYYASIARPSLAQATPASELEFDGEDYEGTIGNPDLDRQQAHNVDFALEWYPSSQGVLSVGVFMKEIRNPIADVVFEDYELGGIVYKEAETRINLNDNASISGLEFNYQQGFDGILPGALGGLILGANYTLVDSQVTYSFADGDEIVSRSIPLPKTSDQIGNVMLGYDKYGLDLRLAYAYRSEYLDEIAAGADGDRYFTGRGQLDFTAKYDVTDNFTVVGEFVNILDEEEHAIFDTPLGAALSQYDEYGFTAKLGVRYTY